MKVTFPVAVCFALLAASPLLAQGFPEMPQPQKEHEWLHQFVGEWDTHSEGKPGPDQPTMTCKGTMTARMIGGFWLVSESKSEVFGQPMQSLQTMGYDTEKNKYVGTWIDSMLNYMWKYEGSVDESGKKLTFEAEGPNFMTDGKTAKFRDTYEFKSADEIIVSSSMQGEDGKWVTMMTGTAKRKAKK